MEKERVCRGMAALIATVAVVAPGCQRQEQTAPPATTADPALRRDGPFESTGDLMEAIEGGTFVERVGLRDEIEAATRQPAPAPVRIEFVSGTDVPRAQQGKLERLAERLTSDRSLEVEVTGCSDRTGAAELNLRVSESRARSVAARLRELGVAEEQITDVVGRGEECPVKERAVNVVSRYRPEEPAPAPAEETPAEDAPPAEASAEG